MGNSAGTALPFEIVGNPIDYERKEWAFHAGLRKVNPTKQQLLISRHIILIC